MTKYEISNRVIAVQERFETGSIIVRVPVFARCPHLPGVQVRRFPYHLAGGVGVSFKMRKRRETGKGSAGGGQRRRAAWLHQSFPCFALHGYSREALPPPQPSPKADRRASTSSFLYFERDPHAPAEWQNRFWTGMTLNRSKLWLLVGLAMGEYRTR
jgi:hypothetical protein